MGFINIYEMLLLWVCMVHFGCYVSCMVVCLRVTCEDSQSSKNFVLRDNARGRARQHISHEVPTPETLLHELKFISQRLID